MIRLAAAAICAALAIAMPARAADRDKVLHWEFRAAETGFDPGRVTDYYSNTVIEAVFERLLPYDYLARPSKLGPEAAEGMPQIGANGKTNLFQVRQGAYLSPDPAFECRKGELNAADVP